MTESWFESLQSPDAAISYQTPRSRDERIREAAIHHANLLQERKDTEMLILESLEKLIDYPTQESSDAAHPAAEDITNLKLMLIPFQPSDYDDLIEERNINRRCGYVLCPNPNKLQGSNAKFGFINSDGKGRKIVHRKVLERWCSPECGKRALYLKVQLAEEPAWERIGGVGGNFVLFDERPDAAGQTDTASHIAESLGKLDLRDDEEKLVAAMKELAVERGDGNARGNSTRLADVNVVENKHAGQNHTILPSYSDHSGEAYDEIEGYRPKGSGGNF